MPPDVELERKQSPDRGTVLAPEPRAVIVVTILGPDMEVLRRTAHELTDRLRKVSGVGEARVEPPAGKPELQFRIDRQKAAEVGASLADIADVIEAATAGHVVGHVDVAGRRMPVMVIYGEKLGQDPERLGKLPIGASGGGRVPLASLVEIAMAIEPSAIYRQDMQRALLLLCKVEDRNRARAVADIKKAVAPVEQTLEQGYRLQIRAQE